MLRFAGLTRQIVNLGIVDELGLPVEEGAEPDDEEFESGGSLL